MFRNSIAKSSISDANIFTVLRQVVVEYHRRNRSEEAGRRRDQRFGDAWRDHPEIGRSGLADALKCAHDSQDRAEQSDERRQARGRREKRNVLLQFVDLDDRCAHQRAIDRCQALESRTCDDGPRIGRGGVGRPADAAALSARHSLTGRVRRAGSRRVTGRRPGPPRICCCAGIRRETASSVARHDGRRTAYRG